MSSVARWRGVASAIASFVRREPLLAILIAVFIVLEGCLRWSVTEILSSVEWRALLLIVALMIVSRAFEFSGQLTQLSIEIIKLFRGRTLLVLLFTMLACAASSTILMNDTSLFVFVPLLVALIKIARLDPAPYIALIASYANAGSALTPIGNPQNIVIWQHYSLSFSYMVWFMAKYVATFLLILTLFLVAWTRRRGVHYQRMPVPPSVAVDKRLSMAAIVALIIVVILAQLHLAIYAPLVSIAAVAASKRIDVVKRIDYVLVLTFLLFFINFAMLGSVLRAVLGGGIHSSLGVYLVSIVLSIAISNVPATIVLVKAVNDWRALLLGVNVAGFATAISSLANLIAIRLSGVSQREFHRYSLPVFMACLAASTILFVL